MMVRAMVVKMKTDGSFLLKNLGKSLSWISCGQKCIVDLLVASILKLN